MNKPAVEKAPITAASSRPDHCSYTNDVARGPKPCQAAPAAKNLTCRIKTQLPRPTVHKAGNALQRGMVPLARLYTNGIFRSVRRKILQRNEDSGEHDAEHDAPDRQRQSLR